MKKKTQSNNVKRIGIWAIVVLGILSIPFISMAPWTTMDYMFAGFVLFGAGVFYEVIASNVKNNLQRIVVAGAILFVVLLIWAWAVA